jgi:hypothetical protein
LQKFKVAGYNVAVVSIGTDGERSTTLFGKKADKQEQLTEPVPETSEEASTIETTPETDVKGNVRPTFADYLKIKAANPDCVVVYQIGDFFEAYQDDAKLIAEHLEMTLTSRKVNHTESVDMVGFPDFKLEQYMRELQGLTGVGVAISEVGEDGKRSVRVLPPIVAEVKADEQITAKPSKIEYKVGDMVIYKEKEYEIAKIDDYVRLRNIDIPADSPINDYTTVLKQSFEHWLTIGDITFSDLPEIEKAIITETVQEMVVEDKPPILDFDTAAQEIFERVMQNSTFIGELESANRRNALRQPLYTVLNTIFYDLALKSDLDRFQSYFSDDDLNDRLFDYLYYKTWESKEKPEIAVTEQTVAEKPLNDLIRQDLEERGFVVDEELIKTGIIEYNRTYEEQSGNPGDIAEFIENEFLAAVIEDDAEYEFTLEDSDEEHEQDVSDEEAVQEITVDTSEETVAETVSEDLYTPVRGDKYEIQGRMFVVDSVNEEWGRCQVKGYNFPKRHRLPYIPQ